MWLSYIYIYIYIFAIIDVLVLHYSWNALKLLS